MNALVPTMAEQLRRHPAKTFALGALYVLAVAPLDYFATPGMSFSLLYLLGIGAVAWSVGRGPAMLLSVLAAGCIFLAEHHAGGAARPTFVLVWNSLSRLAIFLLVAGLTAEMARLTRLLRSSLEERTAQWQAETRRHEATTARLSEAVERFEQIADNIQEVFWLFDPAARRFLYVSPGFERIWGRPCAELYATPDCWQTTLHAEDRARLEAQRLAGTVPGPYEAEYRVVRPDGTVRWIRDRAIPVHNAQGQVHRIAGLAEDITAWKTAWQTLSTQGYILEHMQEAVLMTDEAGVILQTNLAAETLLGYTRAELLSKPIQFLSSASPQDAQDLFQGMLEQAQARGHAAGEYLVRRKDGTAIWMATQSTRLVLNEGQFLVIVGQDVTERKRVEQERSEALELNRTLVAASPVGIAAYKASGQCILANEALARIAGGRVEQLLAQNFRSLASWQGSEMLASAEATLRMGQPGRCEFHGSSSFGKVAWVSFRFASFTLRGAPHLLLLASDITERKEAEQRLAEALDLNQKMLAASLVGIVAHRASGQCVFANEAMGRIVGGPVEQLLRDDFRQLESWQQSGLLQAAEETLRTGEIRFGEFQISTRFGKTVWVDAHLVRFVSAGQQHLLLMCYDISERKASERQVLEISDREQARIGQDLHDGLCQQLVSLAFDANALVGQLADERSPEAAIARRIADLLDQSITEARNVSRGLFPVRLETDGLASALEELAKSTTQRHRVRCQALGKVPGGLDDQARAIHLYRIAQEAVNNAVKHARPKAIRIELLTSDEQFELRITDDGRGLPPAATATPGGLGLHIMAYRARSLGGRLKVGPGPVGGTTICCCIPRRPRSNMAP